MEPDVKLQIWKVKKKKNGNSNLDIGWGKDESEQIAQEVEIFKH